MQTPKFLFAAVASMAVASTAPAIAQDPHGHDTASQLPAPAAPTQCTPGMAANASPGGGMGQMQQGMGGQNMMQMMQMMQQMHGEMQQMHKDMMQMHQEMQRHRNK